MFLAFVAYFALGAYYNYSTYGATGADLIPCVGFQYVSRLPFHSLHIADIETSGEKSHTCSGIWSRTYAPQFDHGKALVEGVTSQYDR